MIITLDKVLKEKGMTQYRLGEITGIAKSSICNLCNGSTSAIKFDNLESICIALDCTPNDILCVEKDDTE